MIKWTLMAAIHESRATGRVDFFALLANKMN